MKLLDDVREDFTSYHEYLGWTAIHQPLLDERWRAALDLQKQLAGRPESSVDGFCWVCGKASGFLFDLKYSNGTDVNWRERLCCTGCGLNNRLRLTMQVLESLDPGPRGYLTEHLTPLADIMRSRYPGIVTSEFLDPSLCSGSVSEHGVRHEDLTRLSLPDASLDFVVSCDVLEHIPDFRAALKEIQRVLKPQGFALLTAPFAAGAEQHIVRARRDGDRVVHLLEPEYHGDPVGRDGILCYYHFGWEILEDLREAGFANARTAFSWSATYANLGAPQVFFIAHKRPLQRETIEGKEELPLVA